ncbi:hypothetical protein [Pyruvatibacter mobilis]|uniref:hypothetical protein n=1 Tax=Pyruvatibacter mobilis TaxID=1712261 RepID=UPI003BA9E5D3
MPVRKTAVPFGVTARTALSVGALSLATLPLAGCGNVDSANLLFYQQQNVGLNIGVNPTTQSANLNLGFDDQNYAIVPVAVKQADGNYLTLKSEQPAEKTKGNHIDSLSVLGQFGLNSGVGANAQAVKTNTESNADGAKNDAQDGTNVGVALTKFFATGSAARNLSQGYMDKLGGFHAKEAPEKEVPKKD